MSTVRSNMAKHIATLWNVMTKTGHGYRHHSLRHTGAGSDRRADKLREVSVVRDDGTLAVEYVPFATPETKLQRAARLGTLTMRA